LTICQQLSTTRAQNQAKISGQFFHINKYTFFYLFYILLSLFLLFATPIIALAQPNFYYAKEYSASNSTSVSSSSVPSSDSCCSSGSGGGSSSSSSGSSSSGGGSSGSGGNGGAVDPSSDSGQKSCLHEEYSNPWVGCGGWQMRKNDVVSWTWATSCRVSLAIPDGANVYAGVATISTEGKGSIFLSYPANEYNMVGFEGPLGVNAVYVINACWFYTLDGEDPCSDSTVVSDFCRCVRNPTPDCSVPSDSTGGGSSSSDGGGSSDSGSSSSSNEPSLSSSDKSSSSSSDEPSSSSFNEEPSSSSDKPSSSSSEKLSSSSSSSEPEPSSSSSDVPSSSNSETGDGVCVASKPFLQKPASYYDDWVYMGKETYGSRHVRGPAKFSTKFFDVLGRAYDKMKANIKYYVFKEAIESKHKVALEFEVYMRVIKDSDGNDVRVFVKEDKANGLRKDSSFYWNGSWEVLEKNDVTRTIKSRTSLGVKIVSLHDIQWRVISNVMTNKYNDTVAYDQYFWENGRLSKTIFNGVKRIFIYGKTLRDTVKVVPHDKNVYPYHPGYDNSAGIIPDENDPEYKYFLMSPYSVYKVPQTVPKTMPMLFKQYNKVAEVKGLKVIYKHPVFKNCTNKDSIYLYGESRGSSGFEPNLNSECQVGYDGCYRLDYYPKIEGEFIELYQSHIKYDKTAKKWREYCVSRSELDSTYFHEITHIGNGKVVLADYAKEHMPSKTEAFTTRDLCESARLKGKNVFKEHWDAWYMREKMHCNGGNYSDEICRKGNGDLKSPWLRPFRLGELCDESD